MAERRRIWIAGGLATAVLVSLAYLALYTSLLARETEQTPTRADFFAGTLNAELSRLEHLPAVIAHDPIALDTLIAQVPGPLIPYLERVRAAAGAEAIFVLDINGLSMASAGEGLDQYHTFRPYFREAVAGNPARFYEVGLDGRAPGYYSAAPVRDAAGTVFGAVVVKVSLADLGRAWAASGALLMVTDAAGVVLVSARPDLLLGMTRPLSAYDRRQLTRSRPVGEDALHPLDWQPSGDGRLVLDDVPYLWTRQAVEVEGWTLHLLSEVGAIRTRAQLLTASGLTVLLAFVIGAALLRARQLRATLEASNADRARLQAEIEERERAERRLSDAQEALARQRRLAALGQLSASITHELGQPISAMRNYITAEEIAQGSLPGDLAPPLTRILERMQRIVDQLRSFGRAPHRTGETFDLAEATRAALGLVRHDLASAQIDVDASLTDGLRVEGEPDRFEQVIVNLLRNAGDAIGSSPTRRIALIVDIMQDEHRVAVRDTGPGLAGRDLAQLQEPFFTTKPSGEGMGLGLAISEQIVSDMGGRMTASTAPTGGAIFELFLPRA